MVAWKFHRQDGTSQDGVVPLGRYIDGDAPVAEHNDDHIASSLTSVNVAALGHEAPNDNKRRKTGSQGAGHQLAIEDKRTAEGVHTRNKKGLDLCRGFQIGNCKSKGTDKHICPSNPSRRHQCEICLDNSHGACDHGAPKADKKGKKGGKDKGGKGAKHGGNKRKWQGW